ncbi:MAG: trypsin-like peptidase domain-containing protein [Defluviitaleaceae bacterium]|nr:trypsin-like peptidase domain-containing protein [Defluviitaleaceae bacterium]
MNEFNHDTDIFGIDTNALIKTEPPEPDTPYIPYSNFNSKYEHEIAVASESDSIVNDINHHSHLNALYPEDTALPRPVYTSSPAPTYTPPEKKGRFTRYLAIAMLAIAIGGTFLGLGLGAGYVTMRHFLPEPTAVIAEAIQPQPGFHSIALEPLIVAIDPHIPDFTQVISTVKDAVVSISVSATVPRGGFFPPVEQPGAGSGFIFAQDDDYVFIATNNHVIANASSITISLDDNERVYARPIGADIESDLAVLAVSKSDLEEKGVPFTVVELGCSESLRMGDSVVAIGNAMGAGQTATKGIVSAVSLQITVNDPNSHIPLTLDVLQTDAAVNQGNSGGPLINQYGEVVGIVTAKLFGHGIEGMGYVLPINDIRELLLMLKEEGSTRHAFIGLTTLPITEPIRIQFNLPALGMLVRDGGVIPDGPAYNAGIQEFDLIVQFNGQFITSFEEYRDALFASRPGDEVILGIYRNRVFMEVPVILGSRIH